MSCPCGSGLVYKECCGRYHRGERPPTAEALMRSRYSAYAKGNVDYILNTTHPDHHDADIPRPVRRKQVAAFCQSTRFLKLEILDSQETTVTFHATLEQAGQDLSFTEKSTFARIDGAWLYLSGISID